MQKTCFWKWIKNYIAMTKSRGGGVFEVLAAITLCDLSSHNDVASIQKNRDDKSHRVIVA